MAQSRRTVCGGGYERLRKRFPNSVLGVRLRGCYGLRPRAGAEFTTIAGWDRQLFPSYIVATATLRGQDEKAPAAGNPNLLGNGSGILGVRVRSPNDNARIRVTISSDLILEPSVFAGTLASQGEEYRINPNLK